MRRLIVLLALAVSLAAVGPAWAGCWATVGISPLPDGVAAGGTWTVDVRVLQHGKTPMTDAAPAVIAANAETGERRTVSATLADPAAGLYRAEVGFPSAGTWSIAVYDGFPEAQCAQTHTFGTTAIAPATAPPAEPPPAAPAAAGGSFPVISVIVGGAVGVAALALAAALALRWRREGVRLRREPVTGR
jgi:hypothetical protein